MVEAIEGEGQETNPNIKYLTTKTGERRTTKTDKNRFFFPKEYCEFEDALKPKQKFSVKFLFNTGARINEALHVKVNDIDFSNNRLVLRVTKAKAVKHERIGRIRTIPISSQFSKYLKKYVNDNKLKSNDYLRILKNSALNQAYKKAGKKIQMKDWWNISSHTFRKTLETWLMALGVDALPLTAHIGHDIKTASQYYVSPDIFSWEEKTLMREILGDLYQR